MNAKKILCPVDFSPCSDVAFEHAVDLARSGGATLVVFHATEPPPTYVSGYAGYGAMPSFHAELDSRMDEIQVPEGVDLQRIHVIGLEGETIVTYATAAGCDLIVMGTHGYGGFKKFFLGSVADYVMRHAKCPVVVIKDKTREKEASS